ncbi:MAG: flagellin [Selenomonadaceae bacterium]|nr:flagellin [Selenomonadaceae bacterium]
MAMTVGGVNSYVSNYNRINSATQKTIQRISTGQKFPTASAGASEYAIAARLTSNIGATSQSIRNTQTISSAIKISEGAINNTIQNLTTIKERLINAANDTNETIDRQAMQKEINQLISEINSNAYVEYNGKTLLDGSQNGLMFAGIDGYENFQAGDLRASTLGLTDDQGNVAIDVSTREAASDSLKIVDQAMTVTGDILDSMHVLGDYVSDGFDFESALDEATTQGAQLQRLEFQEANYMTMEENQLGALSTISDADIARQVVEMRNQQTLEQFALFGMKMFNQNRESIRSLLP